MKKSKFSHLLLACLCGLIFINKSAYADVTTEDSLDENADSLISNEYCNTRPGNPKMEIINATWGLHPNRGNPNVINVTDKIKACCNNSNTCTIRPNNEWLGNHLPGQQKTLKITGRCYTAPGKFVTIYGNGLEHIYPARLECPKR